MSRLFRTSIGVNFFLLQLSCLLNLLWIWSMDFSFEQEGDNFFLRSIQHSLDNKARFLFINYLWIFLFVNRTSTRATHIIHISYVLFPMLIDQAYSNSFFEIFD